MRKIICNIIILSLLFSGILTNTIYAQSYRTAEDAISDANKFLEDKLELMNYYRLENNNKKLNEGYAKNGTNAFSNRPVFAYGDQVVFVN